MSDERIQAGTSAGTAAVQLEALHDLALCAYQRMLRPDLSSEKYGTQADDQLGALLVAMTPLIQAVSMAILDPVAQEGGSHA